MKFALPKIYPITDRTISGLSHLEQVVRLINGGARMIQLRDKQASAADFYTRATEVVDYARQRNVKVIVNDRVDIALAVRADGVHLGQDDLPPEEARKLLGPKAIIGYSTHTVEQAVAATHLPLDYIAIGPIFSTSTKVDPDPVIGLEGLEKVRSAVDSAPLVAIGGIDGSNAGSALAGGADAVAIISDLLSDADEIASRMASLMKL